MADNGGLHTYNYVLVSCHRSLQKANLLRRPANAIYVKGCNYRQVDFVSPSGGRGNLILTSLLKRRKGVKWTTSAKCAVIRYRIRLVSIDNLISTGGYSMIMFVQMELSAAVVRENVLD